MSDQIPLIIPSFNQLFYLRQLVNWWRFHRPEDPIFIVDNASTYEPLLWWLKAEHSYIEVSHHYENKMESNVQQIIQERIKPNYPFYVISDPDILPHPATPPRFLEVLRKLVMEMGVHHAGFGLITEDLPDYLEPGYRDEVLRNEAFVQQQETIDVEFEGITYQGRRAQIDTTFSLYSTQGSGWAAPMPGPDWSSAVRIFRAYHLQWYQHPTFTNPEMDNYYITCRGPVHKDPASAGKNHYHPSKYNDVFGRKWQEHYDKLPPEQQDS